MPTPADKLRDETRRVLADLRLYGVPDRLIRGRDITELWELRDATIRRLMAAPNAA